MVVRQHVSPKVDPLFNLTSEFFELLDVQTFRRATRQTKIGSRLFRDGQDALAHLVHAELPRIPCLVQRRIVLDQGITPQLEASVRRREVRLRNARDQLE